MIPTTKNYNHQIGLSYIEVLIATVIISVALAPMMNSLQTGLQGNALHKNKVKVLHQLSGTLETLLAQPFNELDAAATAAGAYTTSTSYSDVSTTVPYNVFISRYDVDNADSDNNVFTGGEENLLWIKVALLDGSDSFETLLIKN